MINHHGRLYLTDSNICFSSNILGVKTKFVSLFQKFIQFISKET
jgi:hypothetical protein